MRTYVGYYRVSTQAQGRSGLGLEAQRDAVTRHVASVNGALAAEFQEVESGKATERPQLNAALRYCRTNRAILVIAKLDRLARNVRFISQLMESGVEFVAADMPSATKLTVHIIAAMAEYERDLISQRTKASLQAAKLRGVALGNPRIRSLGEKGAARNRDNADRFARQMKPTLSALRASGISSYSGLAIALEKSGIKSQRGGRWTAAGVRNILLRLGAA
jgi:DNA invertase Pin-like site-specific DNA recombinase